MKRIYVYGLTDESDEKFVDWFEYEFYVSEEGWTYLEEGYIYMDMQWSKNECENIAKRIKEKFPETRVEVFEFVMINTPIIKI